METIAIDPRLPDFLMVGAAKSGTTSLYYYLRQHPRIFLPPTKECWYFALAGRELPADPVFSRISAITRLEEYTDQFEMATPEQRLGECSTAYLHLWRQTIPCILSHYADRDPPRIVIVVRNPIARAYSHYLFDRQEGAVDESFEEALARCEAGSVSPYADYLTYGRYSDQVRAFNESFPHVRVLVSDDLAGDPAAVVRDCLEFLGVDTDAPIDTAFRANVSGTPRRRRLADLVIGDNPIKRLIKPFLSDATRQRLRTAVLSRSLEREPMSESAASFLRDYYRDDVLELGRQLDRDLSGWLEASAERS